MDAETMGEVLGELLGIDDDLDGMSTVGRARARARRAMALPPKPNWRKHQLAPGVQAPREGLEPLPLVADGAGDGTFSASVTTLTFRARPQRPFRGERLLASVLRSGTSAAGVAALTTGIFVGTALQQLQIGNFNLEFFAPTAFGVRLDLIPAEPGIDIAINTALSGTLAGSDTINVQLLLLGRSIGA